MLRFLTVVTAIYMAYYLWWRIGSTLNPSALVFSILLLLAEILGLIEFYLFAFMTWDTQGGQASLPPPEDATVDVFVPTYNEDLAVLEATLIGCINMRGNYMTYVLDDGHREAVKLLAERLGCTYFSREINKFAKAGNINEALTKTSGEFIVILDADMIPQPDFLEKTLGYFNDPKTAIVQLPQEFYNLDSAQHKQDAAHWHEQQLFYHVIQPGKNRINAAFWCGSPSIVRRRALESIGGVATDSITEDFLTSIRLNSKGWRIKYHDEALAFGIAPQSVFAFNLQRLRWAQGSMKILKSRDNPLVAPGLTLSQRLSHFSAIFTYFSAYQKLIYLIVPSVFLITGLMPVKPLNGLDFIAHWIPYFILMMLTNKALGRGYYRFLDVEKYNTIKMFIFIKASFSMLISKKLDFKVTPKSVESSLRQKERREMRKQIILLALILVTIIVGAVNSATNILFSYQSLGSFVSAIFCHL
jgi:cellulose synthase (UDP-forming)